MPRSWPVIPVALSLWMLTFGASPPGTRPSEVTIVSHDGAWADLTGVGPVGELGEAESFYLISGTLQNDSKHPIGYVKLSYELLGESGEVVFREYGYNRKAEDLRDDAFERRGASPREMGIEPIEGSGGRDTFRMFFFRDELPPFESYRVLVDETGDLSARRTR